MDWVGGIACDILSLKLVAEDQEEQLRKLRRKLAEGRIGNAGLARKGRRKTVVEAL